MRAHAMHAINVSHADAAVRAPRVPLRHAAALPTVGDPSLPPLLRAARAVVLLLSLDSLFDRAYERDVLALQRAGGLSGILVAKLELGGDDAPPHRQAQW